MQKYRAYFKTLKMQDILKTMMLKNIIICSVSWIFSMLLDGGFTVYYVYFRHGLSVTWIQVLRDWFLCAYTERCYTDLGSRRRCFDYWA